LGLIIESWTWATGISKRGDGVDDSEGHRRTEANDDPSSPGRLNPLQDGAPRASAMMPSISATASSK